jgi:hypothetical protein
MVTIVDILNKTLSLSALIGLEVRIMQICFVGFNLTLKQGEVFNGQLM